MVLTPRIHERVKHVCHVPLLVREKVGVAIGDVHALEGHPVGDRDRGEAQVDQKGDMAVPQVMDPYLFHTGKLRSGFQRVAERVLREGEEAVVFLDVAFHLHVLLEFLREEAGQGDHSLGLLGLRRADDEIGRAHV